MLKLDEKKGSDAFFCLRKVKKFKIGSLEFFINQFLLLLFICLYVSMVVKLLNGTVSLGCCFLLYKESAKHIEQD